MLIELIGTPGSGKTTLSAVTVDLLRERGFAASTIIGAAREHTQRTIIGRLIAWCTPPRLRRLLLWWLFYWLACFHAFLFVCEHPTLSRFVVTTQLRRPIRMARRVQVVFWFFQLAGRERFLTRTARDGEALIVDDGFLHRVVHVYASHRGEPAARAVAEYVDLLPSRRLALRVIAPVATCEARVRQRGVWSHSRRLTEGQLSRYLANSDRAVRFAVRRARERGWTVLDVANCDQQIDEARAGVLAALHKAAILPSTRCPAEVRVTG